MNPVRYKFKAHTIFFCLSYSPFFSFVHLLFFFFFSIFPSSFFLSAYILSCLAYYASIMYNKRGCGYGCGQTLLYFFSGDNTDLYVFIYILYLITWILRSIIICQVQCTMQVLCHWPDPLPNASQTLHQKKGLVYIFAWKHFITQCPRINCTESHQHSISNTIRLHVLQTNSRIVGMLTYAATGSQKHYLCNQSKSCWLCLLL